MWVAEKLDWKGLKYLNVCCEFVPKFIIQNWRMAMHEHDL
jgi:hypothetical protein